MLRIQSFTSSGGGGGGSIRLRYFFFNKVFTFSSSNSPPPVTFMAAAAASSSSYSSLGRSDPTFFKVFHTDSMVRVPYSSNVFRMMTMIKNGGKDLGLTIRSCLDSSSTRNWRAPPRALAPLHLLVRDSDVKLEDTNTSTSISNSTTVNGSSLVNGHWVCQGGKPIGFPDSPLTDKMVVAVDVDEVLGNFVSALNRFIADRYSSNHSVSEYHVYEFFKIWKCSPDEADIRVHEFFKTPYFKTGIHPLPGAQRALHNLSRLCKLSVVTSRQNVIKDHTIEWIEKHYPGVFQEIHFGNHFALNGESRPKSEICRSLGAKVLIDDNPRYAIECADVGIRVLLFDYENSYPWCKTHAVDQHPLVTKVHNWEQVEQQLVSWTVN